MITRDKQKHIRGTFTPKYLGKYTGSMPIQFRSSWELKLMQFCDINDNILKWGSESLVIPYKDPSRENTTHKYYVDFFMEIKCRDGLTRKYVVEVKPYSQVIEPKKTVKTTQEAFISRFKLWIKNTAKWKAATEYAKSRGYEFKIITERELFSK